MKFPVKNWGIFLSYCINKKSPFEGSAFQNNKKNHKMNEKVKI